MIMSARRVTRLALRFADDAEAFVFEFDPRTGVLFDGNDRYAEAYLTGWAEWIASDLGLDPEIRVAAANVRLERLSDQALHTLNLRGVGNHVKFPRNPSASEVFRHAARPDVGDEYRMSPVPHVSAQTGETTSLPQRQVRGVVLALDD
jgi:hypothetical protein